jgi:twitching motility protein PilI
MFSMDDVSEIIPVPAITRVPGVKSWLMGISNLRGTVISIADMGEFLGGKATMPTASSRVVIVKSGEWSYGLLVDEVIGMRHFTSESKLSLTETVADSLRPYVTEVFSSENQVWFTFNVDALLSDTTFLDAAA